MGKEGKIDKSFDEIRDEKTGSNATMVSTDDLHKTTPFVYALTIFATIGGLLFGYDTGIVSGAMLLIKKKFALSSVWIETIISSTIGAAALFSLISGFLSEKLGRKPVIMIASAVFTAGAVVMGAAPNKEVLLVGRIIVGTGIGFVSMTVPVYVAETAPSHIRGRMVTMNQLMITCGILIASIFAGLLSGDEENGWRYMLGIAGIPSTIQFCAFFFLPESPRWLVCRGKVDEARAVLQRIRGTPNVEREIQDILADFEEEKKNILQGGGMVITKMFTTPFVRRALFIGCVFQLIQQLCGINTVIYYSATILKMSGVGSDSDAIWLAAITNSTNFVMTFFGLWLVERLGRRILSIASLIGIMLSLVVLAIGFQLSATRSPPILLTEENSNCSRITESCETCIENKNCGFCYDDFGNGTTNGSCMSTEPNISYALGGRCSSEYLANSTDTSWAYGYCPTPYSWMAILGLALYVMFFAPGMGPMPWTVNSEIYPMWARSTGNAMATFVNWSANLVVSFTFLTLTENITTYGTFWLFCGICFLGVIFLVIFLPETKNRTLEEVQELFMTPEELRKHQLAIANSRAIDVTSSKL